MDANAPIALIGASYNTVDSAERDFTAVWAARHGVGFHHTSVAVLTKGHEGNLRVERSNSTAKHLEWGGALLGGALFVLARPAGIGVLAAVGVSGASAIIAHLHQQARPEDLAEIAALLEAGAAGLVVVVLNRGGLEMMPLLEHAERWSSVDMVWGDLEDELAQDFARPSSGGVLVAT
jgi:hypothetical protein